MSSSLALPTALRQLEEQISRRSSPIDVLQALRALQNTGMSREEIIVHLERARMRNSMGADDDELEENALLALDMTHGLTKSFNLLWDSAEIARIYLPRVIGAEILHGALPLAFTSNDLLPASPSVEISSDLRDRFVQGEVESIDSLEHRPRVASFYRVPKAGFGTRPAAVLYPADRLVYEALAFRIGPVLRDRLVANTTWPRMAGDGTTFHGKFESSPNDWSSHYVVRVDIANFYESINHSLLTVFLREHFDLRRDYLVCIEALLGAVMGSNLGLPQGVPASDAFGTAYLAPLDNFLVRSGWNFSRYVDDVLIGANSFLDGRLKLQAIEGALGEMGLRLNTEKTDILRSETYQRNQSKSQARLERFAQALSDDARARVLSADDKEELSEVLEGLGVEEQRLWDLLYHNSIDIEDVIEDVRASLEIDDEKSEVRALYVSSIAAELSENRRPQDATMSEVEGDLRECLVFLSGARRIESINHVEQLQQWFPALAPYVSAYLSACSEDAAGDVRGFLARWVLEERDTDWVNASLCNTFEKQAFLVDDVMAQRLTDLANNSASGVLTRAVAIRSLATARRLRRTVLENFVAQVPGSVGLELLLAAQADPDGYGTDASALLRALEASS